MKFKPAFDDRDKAILTMFSKNPDVSQESIAKAVDLRQPSVAVRIRKLRDAGALELQAGVDPFRLGLQMAKVDVTTTDPGKVIKLFESCPYFMNGLIISGKNNLSLFFVAENISTLESIVDGHLRRMPEVQQVDFNIVISTAKKMVMPVDLVWGSGRKGHASPREHASNARATNPSGAQDVRWSWLETDGFFERHPSLGHVPFNLSAIFYIILSNQM